MWVPARHGARWIAFLDDDDLWLPRKLAIQIETALRSPHRCPIIATRVLSCAELGDHVWPRRVYKAGESLCDYLFVRKTPFGGKGWCCPRPPWFRGSWS